LSVKPGSAWATSDESGRARLMPRGTSESVAYVPDQGRLGYYMTIYGVVVEAIPFTKVLLRSLEKKDPVDSLNHDSDTMYTSCEKLRTFSLTGIREYDDNDIRSEIVDIFVYKREATSKYDFSSPEYKDLIELIQEKLNNIKARAQGHLSTMGLAHIGGL
jgi:hypothetical protein